MKYLLQVTVAACVWSSCLATKAAKAASASSSTDADADSAKPKRDTFLSTGDYNGPSHKYLPPSSAGSAFGYDTYHVSHGSGIDSGSNLATSSGFDLASLDGLGDGHHYQPQSHQATLPAGYHEKPKVETYIVQSGGSSGHIPSGFGTSATGKGHGYRYTSVPIPVGSNEHVPNHYHIGTSGGVRAHAHQYQHQTNTLPAHQGIILNYRKSPESLYSSAFPVSSHGATSSIPSRGASFISASSADVSAGSGYRFGVSASQFPGASHKQTLTRYSQPIHTGHGAPFTLQLHQQAQQHGYTHQSGNTNYQNVDDSPPAYAIGHKGLGHFSYTSSKPHALHTTTLDESIRGIDSSLDTSDQNTRTQLSKAPFRASVFLGAKHESSNENISYDDFHSSGAGADTGAGLGIKHSYAPTKHYVPISTNNHGGYDYQPPSTGTQSLLLGIAAQSQSAQTHQQHGNSDIGNSVSATPIYESDTSYLPPNQGYQQSEVYNTPPY